MHPLHQLYKMVTMETNPHLLGLVQQNKDDLEQEPMISSMDEHHILYKKDWFDYFENLPTYLKIILNIILR